jgi:TolB-like protein
LEQCLAEIRKVLGDDSRHPRFIKTVPRAGYRFIGNVEEVSAPARTTSSLSQKETQSQAASARASGPDIWIKRRAVLVSLAIVLTLAAGTTIYLIQRRRSLQTLSPVTLPQTPGKRSVAVMFLDNQFGSADLDWLREGLADMLITDLSRSKNLTILSRQQLHTLLDRAGHQSSEKIRLEEALDIAQKSRATIVITGSFARLGDQIRIDAQCRASEYHSASPTR